MGAKKSDLSAGGTPKGIVGKLPPRYKFILNPYNDVRVSKCPLCSRPTHMRKFALLIHIEKGGFLALGKTCRYCSPCELIIAHQDELEDELVHVFETRALEVIGNPYVVFGTVDKRRWKESLDRQGDALTETLDHVADFKKVLGLKVDGGWRPVKASRR
jgi:hypothetical protein